MLAHAGWRAGDVHEGAGFAVAARGSGAAGVTLVDGVAPRAMQNHPPKAHFHPRGKDGRCAQVLRMARGATPSTGAFGLFHKLSEVTVLSSTTGRSWPVMFVEEGIAHMGRLPLRSSHQSYENPRLRCLASAFDQRHFCRRSFLRAVGSRHGGTRQEPAPGVWQ